ncbi:hypothetical protein STEG23_034801 [Scotinomys teguina]
MSRRQCKNTGNNTKTYMTPSEPTSSPPGRPEQTNTEEAEEINLKNDLKKMVEALKEEIKNSQKELDEKTMKKLEENKESQEKAIKQNTKAKAVHKYVLTSNPKQSSALSKSNTASLGEAIQSCHTRHRHLLLRRYKLKRYLGRLGAPHHTIVLTDNMTESSVFFKTHSSFSCASLLKPDVAVHTYNPSTWKMKMGRRQKVQASTWVFPTLGIMHHNKQATENAKEEVLEPSFRQAFPNTNRWFLTCINQPQFKAVLGKHFDKDGWALWYAEHRFPEELTQTFMSCNLITGRFERLDKLRKDAFASVILFGTNHSSSVSGVWGFRGQEFAFPLSPDWQVDYESYTWRKLDPGSEETKTLV